MKKLTYLLLGAAAFTLASCSNEDFKFATNEESKVSIQLSLANDMYTRSFEDSYGATDLSYAVYDNSNNSLKKVTEGDAKFEDDQKSLNIELTLTNGNTYNVVFFAQSPNSPYTVNFGDNEATLSVDYTSAYANSKDLDAFYKNEEITVNGSESKTVKLTRPFAQINVGTDDLDKADYNPVKSAVSFDGVYTQMDLLTGNVTGNPTKVLLNMGDVPGSDEVFPVSKENITYTYLAMGYFLVDKTPSVGDVTYTYSLTNGSTFERTIGSVPVQRNHRTNLYGSLLTSNMNVTVEKDPLPGGDDDFDVENGKAHLPSSVSYDASTNTITVLNVDGLIWLSNVTNNGIQDLYPELDENNKRANDYAFKKYVLKKGVYDLAGIDWNPIKMVGSDEFDGQGSTIKNLKVRSTGNKKAAFIDGFTSTVRNLTIENVDIEGNYHAAGIIASSYANVYDCNVIGGTITVTPFDQGNGTYDEGNNVGGIAAFWGGDAYNHTISNCTVDGLTIIAFRKVGGIIGFDAVTKTEGLNTITGCTVKNTKIIADMRETRYDKFETREPQYGKIVGDEENTKTIMTGNEYGENVTLEVISAKIEVNDQSFVNLGDVINEINNSSENEFIVNLGYSDYQTKNNSAHISWPTNKKIIFKGQGKSNTQITNFDYTTATGSEISFEDLTISPFENGTNHTALGFKETENVSFSNVDIYGEYHVFDGNTTFKNCNFYYAGGAKSTMTRYGLYMETNGDVTIEDCIFDTSCKDNLTLETKGILVYGAAGNSGAENMGNLTLKNVEFKVSGKVSTKAAVEIHSELFKSAGTLTMTNIKYDKNGYPVGLWREVNGTTPTKFFTVILDGKEVQTKE